MYQAFDPYHKWLGILPKDQPPHHYRLLGLVVFESDPDVIDNAANSRMAQLRMYQTGERSAESQALLNEISAARLCLLDPGRKVMYDRQLRQQLAAQEATQPLPPAHPPGVAATHTASSGQAPYAAPAGGAHVMPVGGAPQGVPTATPAVPSAIPMGSPGAVPSAIPVSSPGAVPSAMPVDSPGAVPQAVPAVPVATPIEQMPSQHESPPIYSVRRRQPGQSQFVTMGLVLAALLGLGIAAVFLLGGFKSFTSDTEEKPPPVYYESP